MVKRYLIENARGEKVGACHGVRNFGAQGSRGNPTARSRLTLQYPDATLAAWLRRWSMDPDTAVRTLKITRQRDGRSLLVRASLAAYGSTVETVLSVDDLAATLAPPVFGGVTLAASPLRAARVTAPEVTDAAADEPAPRSGRRPIAAHRPAAGLEADDAPPESRWSARATAASEPVVVAPPAQARKRRRAR